MAEVAQHVNDLYTLVFYHLLLNDYTHGERDEYLVGTYLLTTCSRGSHVAR